jgi:prepilin-type N-terminal cleavage/methylation domain-containing protein
MFSRLVFRPFCRSEGEQRSSRRKRGFTLIELMAVVTILAVLSTVAVVSYKKYLRKGKTMEAVTFLSDIGMKQATYFSVYGQYVDTSNSDSSYTTSDFYPSSISGGDKLWDIECPDDASSYPGWCALGANPNSSKVNFQFVTVGWASGDSAPSQWIKDEERPWWMAIARGDLDNNSKYSTFVLTSEESKVFFFNENE